LFEPTCNAARCTSTSLPTSTIFTTCKRDHRVTQTKVYMQDVKDKLLLSHPLNVAAGLLESHQWTFITGIQRSFNPCPSAVDVCALLLPRLCKVCDVCVCVLTSRLNNLSAFQGLFTINVLNSIQLQQIQFCCSFFAIYLS
jgi:hypothetical protein